MAELRWNPMLGEWVMIASHRQNRPFLPRDHCPFCPGVGNTPSEYDVYAYPNDFPALFAAPPPPDELDDPFYQARPAQGTCDVILYSPDHNKTLGDLSVEHILKIIRLWRRRFEELAQRGDIAYVFPFENRGEEVGVTIHHPHGQLYGYPFIPPRIERELCMSREFQKQTGKCLFCEMLAAELRAGRRVLRETPSFLLFLPFFAHYPYEMMIIPRAHHLTMLTLSKAEDRELAELLKLVCSTYDALFDLGRPFPYMMGIHQAPTAPGDYRYYHFHIEYFPLMRAADKLIYNAGSETCVGAAANPTCPEERAAELREVIARLEK